MQWVLGTRNDREEVWCELGSHPLEHMYVLNRQMWSVAIKLDSPDRAFHHARSFRCSMTRAGVALLMVQTQDEMWSVSQEHVVKSLGPVLTLASFHPASLTRALHVVHFQSSHLHPTFHPLSATICITWSRATSSCSASSPAPDVILASATLLSSFPWSHSSSLLSILTEHL